MGTFFLILYLLVGFIIGSVKSIGRFRQLTLKGFSYDDIMNRYLGLERDGSDRCEFGEYCIFMMLICTFFWPFYVAYVFVYKGFKKLFAVLYKIFSIEREERE